MLNLREFTNEVKEYKNKNKIEKIDNAPKEVIKLFSTKLIIILNLRATSYDKCISLLIDESISLLINEDFFFSKFFKEKENSSSKNINQINYDIFLRKKFIDFSLSWENFSEKKILAKLKKENWLENLNDVDFKSKIINWEIMVEKKIEYKNLENYEHPEDKKIKKHMDIIINNINNIRRIILNDIWKHHYFITEHLGDITPLIKTIYISLRVLRKTSDELDDEFKELKDELVKWLNRDEWIIRSCLFKINKIIEALSK